MGKKIGETAVKIYKPEILVCPFCNSPLKYKYTVSNKVIQFTSGKHFRIKNLGYGCVNCENGITYFSQTANKLSFKGYTYSSKIICMIAYYKQKHKGREEICDILVSKGIEISDRNIDIIYKKFKEIYDSDFDFRIRSALERMKKKFNEIRISLDVIMVNEICFIIFYDFFTSEKLGIWTFNGITDPKLKERLSDYIAGEDISLIMTIRNTKDNKFIPILKELAPNARLMAFNKF